MTSNKYTNMKLDEKELYIILNCVGEAIDKISENDIKNMMDADMKDLEALCNKVRKVLHID